MVKSNVPQTQWTTHRKLVVIVIYIFNRLRIQCIRSFVMFLRELFTNWQKMRKKVKEMRGNEAKQSILEIYS